jgi:hypothetical protein
MGLDRWTGLAVRSAEKRFCSHVRLRSLCASPGDAAAGHNLQLECLGAMIYLGSLRYPQRAVATLPLFDYRTLSVQADDLRLRGHSGLRFRARLVRC